MPLTLRPWRAALLLGLALLALLSFARGFTKMLDPRSGGLDFHAYWYSGHALRLGDNPYRFVLDRRALDVPVSYLDGTVTTARPVAQPGFPRLATNTAPVYLPLATSAFLSWPLARWLWFALNAVLLLLAPALVLRLFPYGRDFDRSAKLLTFLVFFGMTSTRVAVWIGQTTFLIFDLMLAAMILSRSRRLWSGVLLGFALSKYSLSLGAPLALVWEKRRENLLILAVAALVQVAGLLLLATLAGSPPLGILGAYLDVLRFFDDPSRGYQLAIFFPDGGILAVLAPALLAFGVAGFLIWQRIKRPWPPPVMPLAAYEVFTILTLATLLVAYHGIYDLAVAVLFVPLLLAAHSRPWLWAMDRQAGRRFAAAGAAATGLLLLPGEALSALLPAALAAGWEALFSRALVLAILILLGLSMWLLARPHTNFHTGLEVA